MRWSPIVVTLPWAFISFKHWFWSIITNELVYTSDVPVVLWFFQFDFRQSSSTFQNSRYSSSSTSSYKFSGIREETNESGYTYQENRKHSGYSKYANDGLSNGMNTMSLDGLRKPKIDSWDSMGILGLSSKMWNDTSKRQETFMSSTGQFLREENYNSYIMWRCIQHSTSRKKRHLIGSVWLF